MPSKGRLTGEKSRFDPIEEEQSVQEIMKTLSEKEKAQLADPAMPLRHLRANDGNLTKAIQSLQTTLQWRQTFGVDRIRSGMNGGDQEMETVLRRENETGKIYVRGYDAEGRALMYMRPARENTHQEEHNMQHLVWNMEKAIACTRTKSQQLGAEPPLEKFNLVIDYEGFKLRNAPPMSTAKYTLEILQKHYPERLYRAYVLNPPLVFRTFWTLIRPFVDPVTKQKIVFCTGKAGMAQLTDAVTDVHQLEPVAGGPNSVREFLSKEYVELPFDVSFGE